MEKVIYLEPDDEITSVIDKIRKVTQEKVILVVPKAATILQSIVNLKLLKKESQKLGKSISIVTSDDTGRNLASQIGLTVYRDVAKRPVEDSPRPEKAPEAEEKPEEPEEPQTEEDEVIIPSAAGAAAAAGREASAEPKPQVEPEAKVEEPEAKREPEKEPERPEKKAPQQESPKEEPAPQKTSSRFLDIRPSSIKFKPHKDEKRAGIGKEKEIKPLKSLSIGGSKTKKIILAICLSILGLGIIAVVVAYFYLPKADIEVILNAEMITKEFECTAVAGASLDIEKSIVPAEQFSVERETAKAFPATGIKNIGEKAKGTITVINETGTDQPLVANTRFQTPNGLIFRSTSGVVVPKAYLNPSGEKVNGTVNVAVVADQVGESYNIGPSSFTIPGLSASLQSKIYGRSSVAMSGGLTKEVKVISEQDVINAKTAIIKEMSESASQELQDQIDGDSYIIPSDGAKETIIEEAIVPPAGTEATEFNLSLKAKLNILAIKKSEFYQFINQKLAQNIPTDKEVRSEDLGDDIQLKVISREESQELLVATISVPIVAKMDEDVIKGNIKKRSPEEAKAYLESFEEIYEANISLWPFFARRVPTSSSRIILISSYHAEEAEPSGT